MAEYANSQLNLLEAIRGLTLTAERCPKVPGMRVTPVQAGSPGCEGERGHEVCRGAARDDLAPCSGWTEEPPALMRRSAD